MSTLKQRQADSRPQTAKTRAAAKRLQAQNEARAQELLGKKSGS